MLQNPALSGILKSQNVFLYLSLLLRFYKLKNN